MSVAVATLALGTPPASAFTSCGHTSTTCQPTASDDTFNGAFGKKLVVPGPGVLANDSGPDSTTVDVVDSENVSDFGNATVNWHVLNGKPDGGFTYVPDPGTPFSGDDTFLYVIQDGQLDQDFGIVTVHIPVVATDDSYTVTENQQLVVAAPGVLANDVGGDPTSLVLDPESAQLGNVNDDGNGAFDYTPPPGFVGTDSFTYLIDDYNSDYSYTATVTIHVVAPLTAPAPPTNVAATASAGAATVSWSPPASDGGSPVTGYTVTASPGGQTAAAGAAATSATVKGLTDGTAYTFTVTATNAAGTSAPSAPSGAVTPVGPPGAPGAVRATVHGSGIALTWSAPPDGGTPVVGYTVTLAPGGRTLLTGGTRATFSGVAPGTYTARVRATNAAGTGAWSAASNAVSVAGAQGSRFGYWLLGADGKVFAFGATPFGSATGPAVAMAPRADGRGYWVTDAAGDVWHFGAAADHGGRPALEPGEHVSTISATPSGDGYWLFSDRGRAFAYGDARFFGDMTGTPLNGPIVASVATPTGRGYYMVGDDGGVFSFGDARFRGSTGGLHLNRPVVGIAPTPDNRGYWLVASDGGVFAFDAPFRGSMGGTRLNRPVNGLVAYGDGYLMVASDGGIFDFSNRAFLGSLGMLTLAAPIIAIAAFSS